MILVPELFRKLRETPGNNFHLVSSKSKRGCPSYDQKMTYSKALNNRTWALITSTGVVLVVLVLVFVVPGVVFLVLVDVVACHYVYYH